MVFCGHNVAVMPKGAVVSRGFSGFEGSAIFGNFIFDLLGLADLHEVDEEADDDGSQDNEEGYSSLDPPVERRDGGFEGGYAVPVLFGGETSAFDVFGDFGDLGALVL